MKTVDGICAVIMRGLTGAEEVLLVREQESMQAYGKIAGQESIVMGLMEEGESEEETVRREVLEETGFSVKEMCFLRCLPIPGATAWIFLVEIDVLLPRHSGELSWRWINIEELGKISHLRVPTREAVEMGIATHRKITSFKSTSVPP
jgi:8-oxo-dGTP pyrophosphatase MutT (NUDIX family)